MVGILVHGNNHFILSGPVPDEAVALALARHWSIIQIGETKSSSFGQWEIRSKEFRENLEWAVIVPGDREPSQGVVELLGELSARGVIIQRLQQAQHAGKKEITLKPSLDILSHFEIGGAKRCGC